MVQVSDALACLAFESINDPCVTRFDFPFTPLRDEAARRDKLDLVPDADWAAYQRDTLGSTAVEIQAEVATLLKSCNSSSEFVGSGGVSLGNAGQQRVDAFAQLPVQSVLTPVVAAYPVKRSRWATSGRGRSFTSQVLTGAHGAADNARVDGAPLLGRDDESCTSNGIAAHRYIGSRPMATVGHRLVMLQSSARGNMDLVRWVPE